MSWSPLVGGLLSGKYRREDTSGTGRLSGANPFGDSKFTDRNWYTLATLTAVASEIGRLPAEVALAWTLHRTGVASTLIGVSRASQPESNIAAAGLRLDPDQLVRFDSASAPVPGFSAALTAPVIRRMVLGGHDVTGWNG